MATSNSNHRIAEEFKNQSLELLDQSMLKIRNCFSQLSEEQIWSPPSNSLNSIGNLILHSCGNLRQWGIDGPLQTPDKREREAEFSTKANGPKQDLLQLCVNTISEANKAIRPLNEIDLLSKRVIQGFEVTLLQAILHTTTHFAGHTHQIILLARQQLGASYQFAWGPDSDPKRLPL